MSGTTAHGLLGTPRTVLDDVSFPEIRFSHNPYKLTACWLVLAVKKSSNLNVMKGLSLEIEELMDTRRPTGDAELRVWDAHDEDSLYFDCFHEVVASTEGRVWAEGNIRIGDYILIVDSDTRIPRVSATVCQDNYCLREP